jgi:integrase/recombinase XerC
VPPAEDTAARSVGTGEPGLADVVTLQRRRSVMASGEDAAAFFADTVAEYQWARDAAGLASSTLEGLVQPVVELCEYFDLMPWELTPRHLDRYFAGPGKRAVSTLRSKITKIDHYYAFLEQRYAGDILRRFGTAVESPVDEFNRPVHRGEFGLRVPPSQRAMTEFFARWRMSLPDARKPVVACRNYVMAKLAYISGVRAAELCGVKLGDVHWESGQWGRFLVHGKGSRGPGPRQRLAFLFEDGRNLLWWYVEEVRGQFPEDASSMDAPLFPSERIPPSVAALNVDVPGMPVQASTFRAALGRAAEQFLTGRVTTLYPHLLRHACATHNYEGGMGLWEVQKLLGHGRPSTTVTYLATAHADPESVSLVASGRAVQRLQVDQGSLR